MRMCDLTAHTVCKLLLPTNFHVLLELFRLILILAINLIFMQILFKDLIYETYVSYTRYTSYSLNPNNTLNFLIKDTFLLLHTAPTLSLVEVNGFEPMTPSLQS